MESTLHALQDDFSLNANSDTERGAATDFLEGPLYLTDTVGNYLTDTLGNRLIGYGTTNLAPQILHALPDDMSLNTE